MEQNIHGRHIVVKEWIHNLTRKNEYFVSPRKLNFTKFKIQLQLHNFKAENFYIIHGYKKKPFNCVSLCYNELCPPEIRDL